MFKAVNLDTCEDIIILQRSWHDRLSELKRLDRDNLLACPACREAVRLRAGKHRRWHFAHKHLQNCPLAQQSLPLLEARGVLYERLCQLFDPLTVGIEIQIPGLPRPIDCWVSQGSQEMGYWIFDTRLFPQLREILLSSDRLKAASMNWLFISSMLNVDADSHDRVHLTTTERSFMRPSSLDIAAAAAGDREGCSLHYLDHQNQALTTYRRLQLEHKPQRFTGRRLSTPFSDVRLISRTGEFLHPGEQVLLEKYLHQAEAARQRLLKRDQLMSRRSGADGKEEPQMQSESPSPTFSSYRDEIRRETGSRQAFVREGTCIICGTRTTDWLTYDAGSGECICRSCRPE